MQQELDLQVQVSQDFNRNGQSALAEINTKVKNALDEAKVLEKQAKEAEAQGDTVQANQLAQAAQVKRQSANNWQSAGVGLNMLISGLSAPTDSVVGVATATLAPAVSYEIGQKFKGLAKNNADGQLTDQQAAAHVLAHAVLGAAVAATGGNDALAGALSSGGAEAVAPKLSQFLYGTSDPEKLTAEQKETIANMSSLVGAGVGVTIGNGSANAVQGSLNAENAVENNDTAIDFFGYSKPELSSLHIKTLNDFETSYKICGANIGELKCNQIIRNEKFRNFPKFQQIKILQEATVDTFNIITEPLWQAYDVTSSGLNAITGTEWWQTDTSIMGKQVKNGARTPELLEQVGWDTATNLATAGTGKIAMQATKIPIGTVKTTAQNASQWINNTSIKAHVLGDTVVNPTVKQMANTAKQKTITWATSDTGKAVAATGFWNANINAAYNWRFNEQAPTVQGYTADFIIGNVAGGLSSKAKGKIADAAAQATVYGSGNIAKDVMNGEPINYTNAVIGGVSAVSGYAIGKFANKASIKGVETVTKKPVKKGSKTEQIIQHGVEGSLGTLGATWSADMMNKNIHYLDKILQKQE